MLLEIGFRSELLACLSKTYFLQDTCPPSQPHPQVPDEHPQAGPSLQAQAGGTRCVQKVQAYELGERE